MFTEDNLPIIMIDEAKNPVVISSDDFRLLKQFIDNSPSARSGEEMSLSFELSRASIVDTAHLPEYTISLNSFVRVTELNTNNVMEFYIVMPAQADINARKISVLTPMGAALIGLHKGDKVQWDMPSGRKSLQVLDVLQPL